MAGRRRAASVWMALLALALPLWAHAQGTITTVAGSTWQFPSSANNGPATNAPLGYVQGVATDSSGNLYAADSSNNIVVKVTSLGTLTIVAGTGSIQGGYSGDNGPATSAKPGPMPWDA